MEAAQGRAGGMIRAGKGSPASRGCRRERFRADVHARARVMQVHETTGGRKQRCKDQFPLPAPQEQGAATEREVNHFTTCKMKGQGRRWTPNKTGHCRNNKTVEALRGERTAECPASGQSQPRADRCKEKHSHWAGSSTGKGV